MHSPPLTALSRPGPSASLSSSSLSSSSLFSSADRSPSPVASRAPNLFLSRRARAAENGAAPRGFSLALCADKPPAAARCYAMDTAAERRRFVSDCLSLARQMSSARIVDELLPAMIAAARFDDSAERIAKLLPRVVRRTESARRGDVFAHFMGLIMHLCCAANHSVVMRIARALATIVRVVGDDISATFLLPLVFCMRRSFWSSPRAVAAHLLGVFAARPALVSASGLSAREWFFCAFAELSRDACPFVRFVAAGALAPWLRVAAAQQLSFVDVPLSLARTFLSDAQSDAVRCAFVAELPRLAQTNRREKGAQTHSGEKGAQTHLGEKGAQTHVGEKGAQTHVGETFRAAISDVSWRVRFTAARGVGALAQCGGVAAKDLSFVFAAVCADEERTVRAAAAENVMGVFAAAANTKTRRRLCRLLTKLARDKEAVVRESVAANLHALFAPSVAVSFTPELRGALLALITDAHLDVARCAIGNVWRIAETLCRCAFEEEKEEEEKKKEEERPNKREKQCEGAEEGKCKEEREKGREIKSEEKKEKEKGRETKSEEKKGAEGESVAHEKCKSAAKRRRRAGRSIVSNSFHTSVTAPSRSSSPSSSLSSSSLSSSSLFSSSSSVSPTAHVRVDAEKETASEKKVSARAAPADSPAASHGANEKQHKSVAPATDPNNNNTNIHNTSDNNNNTDNNNSNTTDNNKASNNNNNPTTTTITTNNNNNNDSGGAERRCAAETLSALIAQFVSASRSPHWRLRDASAAAIRRFAAALSPFAAFLFSPAAAAARALLSDPVSRVRSRACDALSAAAAAFGAEWAARTAHELLRDECRAGAGGFRARLVAIRCLSGLLPVVDRLAAKDLRRRELMQQWMQRIAELSRDAVSNVRLALARSMAERVEWYTACGKEFEEVHRCVERLQKDGDVDVARVAAGVNVKEKTSSGGEPF